LKTKDNQQKHTKQNSIDLLLAKAEKIIIKNKYFFNAHSLIHFGTGVNA